MKFLNIPVFIVSLAFGFFYIYMSTPTKRVIYVYPNPENVDKIQYKDKLDTCHRFVTNEIKCPSDASKITDYDIQ